MFSVIVFFCVYMFKSLFVNVVILYYVFKFDEVWINIGNVYLLVIVEIVLNNSIIKKVKNFF